MNRTLLVGTLLLASACAPRGETYVLEGSTETVLQAEAPVLKAVVQLEYDPAFLPPSVVSDAVRMVASHGAVEFPGVSADRIEGFAGDESKRNVNEVFVDCGEAVCTIEIPFELHWLRPGPVEIFVDAIVTTDAPARLPWADFIDGEWEVSPEPISVVIVGD